MQRIAFAFSLLAVAGGCSSNKDAGLPPVVAVRGKATLAGGTPVTNVRIQFYPVKGGAPAAGVVGADGAFTLRTNEEMDGIAVGSYKVYFEPVGAEKSDLAKSNATMARIPRKYHDDDSTTLVIEITAEQKPLEIKLDAR